MSGLRSRYHHAPHTRTFYLAHGVRSNGWIIRRYMRNHQPGKALEYYLRLRKPDVFDLIRDHNLFVVVKDQVLLLVEFDQELEKSKRATEAEKTTPTAQAKGKGKEKERSQGIALLVDNPHAIPVRASDQTVA